MSKRRFTPEEKNAVALTAQKWRQGSSEPQNLYPQLGPEWSRADPGVGRMDTPELAEFVCRAVSFYLACMANTVMVPLVDPEEDLSDDRIS